jgi:peptide/nickel transport system permease protein
VTAALARVGALARRRRGRLLGGSGVIALLAVGLWPWDTTTPAYTERLRAPSLAHPFGTDQLGRDVLARVAGGLPLSVGFSLLAVACCALVGTTLGLATGWRDGAVARTIDAVVDTLVAVPAVLVGLVLATVLTPGLTPLFVAVLLTGWTPFARQAHRLTVARRSEGYVIAAVALGAGTRRVLVAHVLPGLLPPLLAQSSLRFANVVLSIAGLSFLGLGPQPPTPEWGAMLSDGRDHAFSAPWLVLAPGLAIVVATAVLATIGHRLGARPAAR